MRGAQKIPYWRLSSFYFWYFVALGALVPYWSLYLKDLGFNASEIGELTAILLGTRIIAPNVWGWLGDHLGQRMPIVRSASLIAVGSFAALAFGSSYWWIASVMLVFSFFWNATMPQVEVVTLQYLGENSHHYSRIRLWGSIGFIISVAALPLIIDDGGIALLPLLMLGLLIANGLSSLLVKDYVKETSEDANGKIFEILKHNFFYAEGVCPWLFSNCHFRLNF